METSLRYSGDSKSLRIHAKQKLIIGSDTFLQVSGELDTRYGSPNYFAAMLTRFYSQPQLFSSFGLGVQYDKHDKLGYSACGKMSFPVTEDSVSFNVKGRCEIDKEFKLRRAGGGAEFTWIITEFQKVQDLRFKVGYDINEKIPYMQFRENNWTFNADGNGRWNVRYAL